MDITKLVCETIETNGVKLAKLTVRDRCKLMRSWRERQRSALVRTLKDSALPSEQAFVELSRFDEAEPSEADWIRFVNTIDGQEAIAIHAIDKANKIGVDQAAEVLDAVDIPLAIIVELCGMVITQRAPEGEKGPDPISTTPPETAPAEELDPATGKPWSYSR